MILVDTSVWVDHLRSSDATLVGLLENSAVIVHPFVVGELALGNLRSREVIINTMNALPQSPVASTEEVLAFIAANALAGTGIGLVDAHLLASVCLGARSRLWTRDPRLRAEAARMNVSADFS